MVLTEDLTRTQIVQYAGASGDYNPLHTDATYAQEVAGYPGVFAHGMLTMGMTGRALTDLVGDGRLTAYGVRFTSQVWPGERLVARRHRERSTRRGRRRPRRPRCRDLNAEGVPVISGYATARARSLNHCGIISRLLVRFAPWPDPRCRSTGCTFRRRLSWWRPRLRRQIVRGQLKEGDALPHESVLM